MQYFPLLNFQHMVLALCLGIGFVILVYIALCSYKRTRQKQVRKSLTGSNGVIWRKRMIRREAASRRF